MVKCKLTSIVANRETTKKLRRTAELAHEIYKRASLFLRHFCLSRGSIPEANASLFRHCINSVCMRDHRGSRPKGEELGEEMEAFWEMIYC